ncbi:Glycosyltransferase family 28 N-terminal domain-containing protein [Prauserella marina]|uniref:Glycosyltransferase family 28 N-terminal domain-containing protein n=1 Tax=Prauserella marina TaxID=530584 RepID=A0A1G6TSF3_9PSEU|nr:glycosyltransferase [Prauserella marina]PWV75561.1 glycosyl transferase family 28 [Prauserella marina]SDD31834.1 Glycosyltransferase family 28 N-terminal domain-containing protein [Prauserella marina]
MKALLVTHGTRGDVQPFLALALALRAAGHHARLAAPVSFAAQAQEHGVEFAGLDEGPNRLMADPVVRKAAGNGYRGLRGKISAVRTARRIKPLMADVLRDLALSPVKVARRGGALAHAACSARRGDAWRPVGTGDIAARVGTHVADAVPDGAATANAQGVQPRDIPRGVGALAHLCRNREHLWCCKHSARRLRRSTRGGRNRYVRQASGSCR